MYIAIIGDIIASRSAIENRYAVQEELKETLSKINELYESDIKSSFTLTLGDEFQGLLHPTPHLFEILDYIRIFHNKFFIERPSEALSFRFGIGIGSMLTAIDAHSSLGADGPAYWNARKALEHIHNQNDYGYTNIHIAADFTDLSTGALLIDSCNDTLRLCGFIESKWRRSQQRFVADYLSRYGFEANAVPQIRIAEDLQITPQQVTQSIKRTGLYQYLDARLSASILLDASLTDGEQTQFREDRV